MVKYDVAADDDDNELMMMMRVKVQHCRRAYYELRVLFHSLCGNVVDAGNAMWLGLAMYIVSAVLMFFISLTLMHAVRTSNNRVLPARQAVVDLDRPPPQKPDPITPVDSKESLEYGDPEPEPEPQPDWRSRRQSAGYRIPGQTHGDWLQNPEERRRRSSIAT